MGPVSYGWEYPLFDKKNCTVHSHWSHTAELKKCYQQRPPQQNRMKYLKGEILSLRVENKSMDSRSYSSVVAETNSKNEPKTEKLNEITMVRWMDGLFESVSLFRLNYRPP